MFLGALLLAIGTSRAAQVVILTPHVDAIRIEFARGFSEWHAANFGEPADVQWRNVGGTSDALRFVLSEFSKKPGGIGLDLLFGGGQEPYLVLADKKLSARYQPAAAVLEGIPREFQGMEIYDEQFTWFAAALSSFGILQNTLLQRSVGLDLAREWGDLANPKLHRGRGEFLKRVRGAGEMGRVRGAEMGGAAGRQGRGSGAAARVPQG